VLFGGNASFRTVPTRGCEDVVAVLFEAQVGLILLTLARGLRDFIWGIRQLNYVLAAIGAIPEEIDDARHQKFADIAGRLLTPRCTR